MRSGSERKRVSLGLIGSGPIWDQRYRHAVRKLRDRLKVRAVTDAVLSRAELLASEIRATPITSLVSLFERTDLQAILLMDSAWFGDYPLELACRYRKPIFVAGSLQEQCQLDSLDAHARDQGTTVMVEFSHRHDPATGRLRELMATRLGKPRTIEIDLPSEQAPFPGCATLQDRLIGWLDWCSYIAGWSVQSVHARVDGLSRRQVDVQFGRKKSDLAMVSARLTLGETARPARQFIECEHGWAELLGPRQIRWQNGVANAEEELREERTAAEVMLDQFCRRVVGGLVPVPGLMDVAMGRRLAEAVAASEETSQLIFLDR